MFCEIHRAWNVLLFISLIKWSKWKVIEMNSTTIWKKNKFLKSKVIEVNCTIIWRTSNNYKWQNILVDEMISQFLSFCKILLFNWKMVQLFNCPIVQLANVLDCTKINEEPFHRGRKLMELTLVKEKIMLPLQMRKWTRI